MLFFIIFLAILATAVLGFQRLRYTFVEAGDNVSGWQRRRSRQVHLRRPDAYKPRTFPAVISEESFITNARGTLLFTKCWLPADLNPDPNPNTHPHPPRHPNPHPNVSSKTLIRGLVLACHGWGDTCCYLFEDPAGELASAGYAVFALDHEGFGMSDGLHGYIPDFGNIVDDVVEVGKRMREEAQWKHLPLFLYGDSMGGAIALQAHRRAPHLFDGAVLVAPMCKIGTKILPSPLMRHVLTFLAHLLPRWRLVPKRDMDDMAFRDPIKRQYIKDHPFRSKCRTRLGSALELLHVTQDIGSHLHEVSLPLLVLHGSKDCMTDPNMSQELHKEASSKDKTLKMYPESWHSLATTEPDDISNQVMRDIIDWLNVRTSVHR